MQSIRARQVVAEQARARLAERLEREAAARAALEEYTREYLERDRAAAHIGVSIHQLKRMMAAHVGPAYLKFGTTRQAVVRFPRAELDEWLADPTTYQTTRADRMAALARLAAESD